MQAVVVDGTNRQTGEDGTVKEISHEE